MRNPFIAGSWVRGENFFGRGRILQEILEGGRHSLWVVGARRLGKTSLLKELERQVQQSGDTPFVSLYWDLQGSADARGLAESLMGSVEDSEPYRRATNISVEDLEGLSASDVLTTLIRRTVRSGWRLLLLVDEAEEFLNVGRSDPSVLARIRRLFQKGPEVRTVITSTRRLARIDEITDLLTSPFLHSFVPPLYLTPLSREEGRSLLSRGAFAAEDVETILDRSACHPFLLQLMASRLFESHDLGATIDQLAADDMVANFFAIDFQTLEAMERSVLEELAREGALGPRELSQAVDRSEDALQPSLFGLTQMGYLTTDDGRYRLGNWFFERWLKRVVAARASEVRPA
jgi:hypothetical protein